jgi:hypothetical protein
MYITTTDRTEYKSEWFEYDEESTSFSAEQSKADWKIKEKEEDPFNKWVYEYYHPAVPDKEHLDISRAAWDGREALFKKEDVIKINKKMFSAIINDLKGNHPASLPGHVLTGIGRLCKIRDEYA